MKNKLEIRIEKIEAQIASPVGTTISRVLSPHGGLKWCVGFGQILMPKVFFDGITIEECIEKAEKVFLKRR